jgi:hypothetical protein
MPRVRRAGQRHLTPLVGREEELAMLMRRWERARKGDGQLVLIVAARGKLGPCSTPGGRLRWVEPHRVRPSALAHGIVILPSLVTEKPCAAVADLSPTKRAAVIECFKNRGLHKCNGYWCGPPEGKHISGVTVADLARDGVFTVIKNLRHGSAQLTERGQWFAGTLIAGAN